MFIGGFMKKYYDKCILNEEKECNDCGKCDFCDLEPTKTCDNCEKCLDNADYNGTIIEKVDMKSF